jgi:hypothetical protein
MTTLTHTLTTPLTAVQDDYCTEPPIKPDVSPIAEEMAKIIYWSGLWDEAERLMRQCKAWQRDLVKSNTCGHHNGVVWQMLINIFGYRRSVSSLTGYCYDERIPHEMLASAAKLLEDVLAICEYMQEVFHPDDKTLMPIGGFAGNDIDIYA